MNRNSNLSDCKRPTPDWKWRLSDKHSHSIFHPCLPERSAQCCVAALASTRATSCRTPMNARGNGEGAPSKLDKTRPPRLCGSLAPLLRRSLTASYTAAKSICPMA